MLLEIGLVTIPFVSPLSVKFIALSKEAITADELEESSLPGTTGFLSDKGITGIALGQISIASIALETGITLTGHLIVSPNYI